MAQSESLVPDLDAVLERNADDFAAFRGARLFIIETFEGVCRPQPQASTSSKVGADTS